MPEKHIRTILMSLDTDTGKLRRDKIHKWNSNQSLKNDYELYPEFAITDINLVEDKIKKQMRKQYNINEKLWERKCCHFQNYIYLLKKIVSDKINHVIICEDDALMRHPGFLFYGRVENIDGPILLGSKLHHPTSWKLDTKKYFKEVIEPCLEEFSKSDNNVKVIDYDKYRWSCCACIYYPKWEHAQKILDFYDSDKKMFTFFDLWASKNKLINHLYYPSVYEINDGGVSQVNDCAGGVIYNYKIHNYGTL
jgi:hypothetical protein